MADGEWENLRSEYIIMSNNEIERFFQSQEEEIKKYFNVEIPPDDNISFILGLIKKYPGISSDQCKTICASFLKPYEVAIILNDLEFKHRISANIFNCGLYLNF